MGPWDVDIALDAPDGTGASAIAAGVGPDRVVLARGIGGHRTGWFAARAAVHGLLPPDARFFGVAHTFPADWGWAGARQDAGGAAWAWSHVEPLLAAPTGDLVADLAAVDGAIAALPSLPLRLHGPVASVVVLDRDGSLVQLGDVRVLASDGSTHRDLSRPTTVAGLLAAARQDPLDAVARRFGLDLEATRGWASVPAGDAPPGHARVLLRALGTLGGGPALVERVPTAPGARVDLALGGGDGERCACVLHFAR